MKLRKPEQKINQPSLLGTVQVTQILLNSKSRKKRCEQNQNFITNFVTHGSFESMGGDGLHMMMILCKFDDLM